MDNQPYNPLHGITLAKIVTDLEQHFGFERLAKEINIRCFSDQPSIKSSLKFLRKTPWARDKVEQFYIKNKHKING
ncbi:VF530 family DNA-binding protein [Thalassotalea aquiviva]|uniref:VF530 family protein n=1 Tax=Thalassotalea aquiviva TaxID=3242415 RepID=UPI003529F6B2